MSITIPSGFTLDSACPVSTTPLDPTGQNDPYVIGNGQFGTTGKLASNACTTWYESFNLDSGDPFVFNNNIPLKRDAAPTVAVPLFGPFGYLLMAALFGFFGIRRLKD